MHHFATNKNSKFTPQLSAIAKKYGLDLNGSWNKELMPHLGRHPNAYHQYVLDAMTAIDKQARGSQQVFLDLYNQVKSDIMSNPGMLNKSYWKGK